jgi:hypothetical protein
MAPACTGVGVENRAAMSRSFKEGDIDKSEKLCIVAFLLASVAGRAVDTRCRGNLYCQSSF